MASEDAAVGYKRPPVNRQFKKGQSGNPHGRPKGAGVFSSIMDDILNEEMRFKINGRQVVVTGRDALGRVMADRAARGDVRMIQLMLKYGCFRHSDQPAIMLLTDGTQNL